MLPAALAILEHIHAKGVIHGDLKESNFLVDEPCIATGGAKTIMLIDFSHSRFDTDKDAQDEEVEEMLYLFDYL